MLVLHLRAAVAADLAVCTYISEFVVSGKKKFNFSTAGTKFYNYYKIFVQFISAAIKEDFFPETNSDMKVHHQNNIAAPT